MVCHNDVSFEISSDWTITIGNLPDTFREFAESSAVHESSTSTNTESNVL